QGRPVREGVGSGREDPDRRGRDRRVHVAVGVVPAGLQERFVPGGGRQLPAAAGGDPVRQQEHCLQRAVRRPVQRGAALSSPPVGPTVRTEGSQLIIGSSGSAPGQLNSPSDVALDAAGNIYVADTNNNRIQKYDPQGNYLAAVGGFTSDVKLNQPWSLTVAPD